MKITNHYNINLLTAAWLLQDGYDYINDPDYYSVTTLMKPTKQVILSRRVDKQTVEMDISSLAASRRGAAIHDSIESTWTTGEYKANLERLGYPASMINRIMVNPTPEELAARAGDNPIPIYFERRGFKKIGKFTLGAKFDVVAGGVVEDFKTTSVFKYTSGKGDDDYKRQLSSYRFVHDDVITEDYGRINYIFTDWLSRDAKTRMDYPQIPLATVEFELESPEFIEQWAHTRMTELDKLKNAPESQLPRCTDEELWRSAPVYKYYADPTKVIGGRATKNFDNPQDARAFHQSKGGKGVVITVPGEVKACSYCPAFSVCKQKDEYL